MASHICRRGLDRHRLARHHGRRRPQRVSRRRSRDPYGRDQFSAVAIGGPACQRLNAGISLHLSKDAHLELGFGMVFRKIEKLDEIAVLKDRWGFGVKFSYRW